MMQRRVPFVTGELYHLFNRGANKSDIFLRQEDYHRFLLLAYLANTTVPVNIRQTLDTYKGRSFDDIFLHEKQDEPLVEIFAYALMPNHFHFVVRQRVEQGIVCFMKKFATGYSMYFNTKYEHSGVLFQGRFKSVHIDNEAYYRYIFAYVHLNPISLVEPGWEEKEVIQNRAQARSFLNSYQYSSFYDYSITERPMRKILSYDEAPDFLTEQNDLDELLESMSTKDGPL